MNWFRDVKNGILERVLNEEVSVAIVHAVSVCTSYKHMMIDLFSVLIFIRLYTSDPQVITVKTARNLLCCILSDYVYKVIIVNKNYTYYFGLLNLFLLKLLSNVLASSMEIIISKRVSLMIASAVWQKWNFSLSWNVWQKFSIRNNHSVTTWNNNFIDTGGCKSLNCLIVLTVLTVLSLLLF